jgi:hypothetical protein
MMPVFALTEAAGPAEDGRGPEPPARGGSSNTISGGAMQAGHRDGQHRPARWLAVGGQFDQEADAGP